MAHNRTFVLSAAKHLKANQPGLSLKGPNKQFVGLQSWCNLFATNQPSQDTTNVKGLNWELMALPFAVPNYAAIWLKAGDYSWKWRNIMSVFFISAMHWLVLIFRVDTADFQSSRMYLWQALLVGKDDDATSTRTTWQVRRPGSLAVVIVVAIKKEIYYVRLVSPKSSSSSL